MLKFVGKFEDLYEGWCLLKEYMFRANYGVANKPYYIDVNLWVGCIYNKIADIKNSLIDADEFFKVLQQT